MGTIKDRNDMHLTEAEEIKKRWQEYTEELHKKVLLDPDNHDDVITHPEPDFLECKVQWASGNIAMNKASEGDGIPAELFKMLKVVAVTGLNSICQQIWRTQQWLMTGKDLKKGNYKKCSNYSTVELISHSSKILFKILQARLPQDVN